jgi:hypothetical protein
MRSLRSNRRKSLMAIDFGLGCFHFVPVQFADANRGPRNRFEYQEEVTAGLGQLVSVTNLNVDITGIHPAFRTYGDLLETDDSFDMDLNRGPSEGSRISFDVVIPKRIHRELTYQPLTYRGQTLELFPGRLSSESFRVESRVYAHGPVTYIGVVETSKLPLRPL